MVRPLSLFPQAPSARSVIAMASAAANLVSWERNVTVASRASTPSLRLGAGKGSCSLKGKEDAFLKYE